MTRNQQIIRILFAVGMMSVGVLTLIEGCAVLVFQPVSTAWVPLFKVIGWAYGIILLGTGAGLLSQRTASVSIRILLPALLIWTASRVPVVIADPGREISWFAVGEIAVLAAGALVLFARHADLNAGSSLHRVTSAHALQVARVLFALSVVTYGLSHFFEFAARTVSLVPAWLPYRAAWADLTGAAQIAAGLGALLSIYPRWAAALEAMLLSMFTILIWVPVVVTKPADASNWDEFLFTFALAGAAWVVAESIPGRRVGTHER